MRQPTAMLPEFEPLATYNSEVARGLLHDANWVTKMAALQEDFDDWVRGGCVPQRTSGPMRLRRKR